MKDSDVFEIVDDIKTWEDLKSRFSGLSSNCVFRGQSKASWDLKSSIDRATTYDKIKAEERSIYNLKKHLNLFPLNSRPASDIELLIFLQHYGAPTRLLDFTYSPYVASFFSLSSKVHGMSAIYALDAFHYQQLINSKEISEFLAIKELDRQLLFHELSKPNQFEKLVLTNNDNAKFVMQMGIPIHHERSIPQASTFLVQGDLTSSFIENLHFILQGVDFSDSIIPKPLKYIFPNKLREEALRELKLMNIGYLSLFPGLDGLAKQTYLNFEISEHQINCKLSKLA